MTFYITSIAVVRYPPDLSTFQSEFLSILSYRVVFDTYLLPSWRINKLVPLSLGVFVLLHFGFITIASPSINQMFFVAKQKD